MVKIDLHMHTTASDGDLSPSEIVDLSISRGMRAIAITDHEILSGSLEALKYSRDKDLDVVTGVEIGADDEDLGIFDVHIVGLFIDLENKALNDLCNELLENRVIHKKKLVEKLNELGYDISFDELKMEVGDGAFGRPHVARILMRKYPEEFPEMQTVFDKLLGNDAPAYVRPVKKSLRETVNVIHDAGGVAILAHPGFYFEKMEALLESFVAIGGDGVEVSQSYGNYNGDLDELFFRLEKIVSKYGLIVSGGGDFHRAGDFDIGDFGLTESEFEKLKSRLNM